MLEAHFGKYEAFEPVLRLQRPLLSYVQQDSFPLAVAAATLCVLETSYCQLLSQLQGSLDTEAVTRESNDQMCLVMTVAVRSGLVECSGVKLRRDPLQHSV